MTKNYFDIHSLILKGTGDVREYELPAGKVLIRPLTEIEVEECELAMFQAIKDPATLEFMFNITPENLKTMQEGGVPAGVNPIEFIKANNEYMYTVAFNAMKDFTDSFTIDQMKKIPGIKDLAKEVLRISGYSAETLEQVAEFREE